MVDEHRRFSPGASGSSSYESMTGHTITTGSITLGHYSIINLTFNSQFA